MGCFYVLSCALCVHSFAFVAVAVGGGVADGVATRRTKVGKKNGMCRGKDGEVNERARGVEKRRDGPGVGRADVGVVAAAGVV